jgi:hypothetical protein
MLTWGSIASSLAEVASNPEAVNAKNGKLLAEKAMSSSSHARGGDELATVEQKTRGRDITPTRSARQTELSHGESAHNEGEVRERSDGEAQIGACRKTIARKNRSASFALCGQKEHLIQGGMNSSFHSAKGK